MSHPNGPILAVNLVALAHNYRLLAGKTKRCAAVVKANAYGLGVKDVAPAFYQAGCRTFFVATLSEGIELRNILTTCHSRESGNPETPPIFVFHGARKGEAGEFKAHALIPVLNSLEQCENWPMGEPAALHIDTGMCRLGVAAEECGRIKRHAFRLILSHLACANDKEHPKNREQLDLFQEALLGFPGVPASLANSSGVFLGSDYHFDLVRPGCSLYGISPDTSQANPMEPVAILTSPVLQYRHITRPQSVGYGATADVQPGRVLATVEIGYADGLRRALSGHGFAYAGDIGVPFVGRVSMDMVSVDVTEVPENLRTTDLRLEFIGPHQPVDVVAEAANTIGYEILTGMGPRVTRVYKAGA